MRQFFPQFPPLRHFDKCYPLLEGYATYSNRATSSPNFLLKEADLNVAENSNGNRDADYFNVRVWKGYQVVTNEEIEAKAIHAYEERKATPSTAERQRAATYRTELVSEMERIFQEDPELPDEILYGKPVEAYGIPMIKAPNSGLIAVYDCAVCHEEHTFPVGSLVAAGEFYTLRAKGLLKCTSKPKTTEEKLLDVLGEIRDALKAKSDD